MRLQTSILLFFVAAAPVVLRAANPRIAVDRDPPDPTIILSKEFNFGTNSQGGGDFAFQNETGVDWREMTVTVTLSRLTPIVCGPGPFEFCTIAVAAQPSGSFMYDIMFGPTANVAVANGEIFSINLNDKGTDPNGSGSWASEREFNATVNDIVPEPSAGLLATAGLALLGAFCLYRRRAPTA